jgi:nicotinamidase-related amidase
MQHGEATALIVVDVLNAYEHEDADKLIASVDAALPKMEALLGDARERDLLRIYVNDNFDDWTLDRGKLVERAMQTDHGRRLVEPLAPDEDVPLVLKGRHSIFWETPMSFVLQSAGIDRIVLCGQVTEQCILYSALDAHIRMFGVTVVPDACAHIDAGLADASVEMMRRNMHARIAGVGDAFDAEG